MKGEEEKGRNTMASRIESSVRLRAPAGQNSDKLRCFLLLPRRPQFGGSSLWRYPLASPQIAASAPALFQNGESIKRPLIGPLVGGLCSKRIDRTACSCASCTSQARFGRCEICRTAIKPRAPPRRAAMFCLSAASSRRALCETNSFSSFCFWPLYISAGI